MEHMKRLLCIVSSLDTGGAETFMMKIFRSLPEEYKLDFIVSTNSGFYEKEVYSLGGKIYRVPLRTKNPIKTFKAIKKVVKNNHYKYVLKLCDTPIGIFDLLAAKLGGAKKLCVRSCNAASNESKLKHIVNSLLRPIFNKITDVKIAPSKLAAEYTFGKNMVNKNKVYFLHNAVDLDVYKYKEEGRNKIRQEFGIESQQLVLGHIGRFNYQKNHMFLLEVFACVKQERKDAVLLLVGDGEKKSEIIKKVNELRLKDSVIFAGIRWDIPELLSAMDVFVFPSFYEGMPNTVIEAQAIGLPCIISDTITKEANITNLVKYISLDEICEKWSQEILSCKKIKNNDTKEKFLNCNYDIESSVKKFEKIIFGNERLC